MQIVRGQCLAITLIRHITDASRASQLIHLRLRYSFKEGLEQAFGSNVKINYERGCDWDSSIMGILSDMGGDERLEASKLDMLVDILRSETDPMDWNKAMEYGFCAVGCCCGRRG